LVPGRTVAYLLRGEASLEELLVEGPPGIRLLPAASGVPELARLDPRSRARLFAALVQGALLADAVVVDTGAGVGDTSMAMQLAASQVILVTTPEPTSLVGAYASLKLLWSSDPAKRVDVVVNAVENEEEGLATYEQIARAAAYFLRKKPGWLGAVYRDPNVADAVRRQRPLMETCPESPAALCYERIALLLASQSPMASRGPSEYWQRLMETCVIEPMH
jgi:flagellar biosynthesis protein FlhG